MKELWKWTTITRFWLKIYFVLIEPYQLSNLQANKMFIAFYNCTLRFCLYKNQMMKCLGLFICINTFPQQQSTWCSFTTLHTLQIYNTIVFNVLLARLLNIHFMQNISCWKHKLSISKGPPIPTIPYWHW